MTNEQLEAAAPPTKPRAISALLGAIAVAAAYQAQPTLPTPSAAQRRWSRSGSPTGRLSEEDLDRLAAAQEKRDRRAAKRIKNLH